MFHFSEDQPSGLAATSQRSAYTNGRIAGFGSCALLAVAGLGPQLKLGSGGVTTTALSGEPFAVTGVIYVLLAAAAATGLAMLQLGSDAPRWPLRTLAIATGASLVAALASLISVRGDTDGGFIAPGWGLDLAVVASVALLMSAVFVSRTVRRRDL